MDPARSIVRFSSGSAGIEESGRDCHAASAGELASAAKDSAAALSVEYA